METFLGLLVIAVGSFGQSSSYVPIRRIEGWSWENFWLMQGVFAWLLFPSAGALLAATEEASLRTLLTAGGSAALKCVGYGILWGIGGLTFGLSMRYLGVALGQSVSLGTCSAFGTLIPALLKGDDLFSGPGLVLLAGVSITLAGIAVIGYAGNLRSRQLDPTEQRVSVQEFALKKGLLIALLAGLMSACFSLGLDAGAPIRQAAVNAGASDLFALNPVILSVTAGGFLTNLAYCLAQHRKNGTARELFSLPARTAANNLLFCALAGLLWYSQFFGLGMGQSFFEPGGVMLAFSWSILMSLNVVFSNLWGVWLKEWRGADRKTIAVLASGMAILIFSLIFTNLF